MTTRPALTLVFLSRADLLATTRMMMMMREMAMTLVAMTMTLLKTEAPEILVNALSVEERG
jgi:hypothetical protein